jgi:hypothetical protein
MHTAHISSNRITGLTNHSPTIVFWMKQPLTTHYKKLKSHIGRLWPAWQHWRQHNFPGRPGLQSNHIGRLWPAWQRRSQHSFPGHPGVQSSHIGQSARESGGASSCPVKREPTLRKDLTSRKQTNMYCWLLVWWMQWRVRRFSSFLFEEVAANFITARPGRADAQQHAS